MRGAILYLPVCDYTEIMKVLKQMLRISYASIGIQVLEALIDL